MRMRPWRWIIFLLAFVAVLLAVSYGFLIPALEAARDADERSRRQLVAVSALLLAIVLFVLLALLMLSFRVGRFFLPRKPSPRTRTSYPDAWQEAGRRLKTPEE